MLRYKFQKITREVLFFEESQRKKIVSLEETLGGEKKSALELNKSCSSIYTCMCTGR